jgi:DNA (cytosine-5)-methyltransferase 1
VKFRNELYRILDKNTPSQTLVATDAKGLYVTDGDGLRRLTHKECLRLFGFPENFKFNVSDKEAYDLLGNSVTVPVIKFVAEQLLRPIVEKF